MSSAWSRSWHSLRAYQCWPISSCTLGSRSSVHLFLFHHCLFGSSHRHHCRLAPPYSIVSGNQSFLLNSVNCITLFLWLRASRGFQSRVHWTLLCPLRPSLIWLVTPSTTHAPHLVFRGPFLSPECSLPDFCFLWLRPFQVPPVVTLAACPLSSPVISFLLPSIILLAPLTFGDHLSICLCIFLPPTTLRISFCRRRACLSCSLMNPGSMLTDRTP